MSPMRLGGYLLAGLIAPTLHAQDAAAVVAVEQAAIRYMTKGLADSTVAINPEYVQEGTAPGFPTNRARSAENAQALRAVGFKALKRAHAISCVQRECTLHNAAAFVSISQPRIDNDTAQVTVTIDRWRQ